ncbi:MAG: hypothetical protein AAGJ40_21980 [Planctomycetota bacterium]
MAILNSLAHRFGILAACLLPHGTLCHGQDPLDLSEEVPIWIDELDANDLKTRRAAERQLIDAGPKAARYIPADLNHLSLDAEQRLELVRQRWKSVRTRRESAEVIVRFGEAATVAEALEAISSASEVEFAPPERGGEAIMAKRIQLPSTPTGFWHALDIVLDRANLDINFYGGARTTLQLIPRSDSRPSRVDSAAYAGVYRIEPTVVTARRVLNDPALSGLNITMSISWQPGRQPIGLTIPVNEIQARLDNQTSLRPQNTADTIDVATSSELAQSEFFLPMQLPDGSPERIEQITGTIAALLPGRSESFELTLGQPAASQVIDSMSVRLEDIRSDGPLHELRVGIELDDADRSLESHRQWIFENDAYVRLEDGTRLDHLGYQTFRQTTSGVGIGYLFDLGGGSVPATAVLVYQSPTAVIPSEIPIVIRDIQLP